LIFLYKNHEEIINIDKDINLIFKEFIDGGFFDEILDNK